MKKFLPFLSPILLITAYCILITSPIKATDYQQCSLGDTCEIGEFLYDDDYSIYTGATCTLDAKDPVGTTFLSSVTLTESADGWYSYSFDTTGDTEGLYRATICCTAGSDYLCLDKTWEINASTTPPTAGEIADAVLDENITEHTGDNTVGSSLNSISGIASSVWDYSTRSLSTFGTLVSDFWQHDATDATTTTNSAYNTLMIEIQDNRLALEELLAEPIITSFLEEGTPPDVKAKIAATREHTNSLYSLTQSTMSRLNTLDRNWETLSRSQITSELALAVKVLGSTPSSAPTDSVIGYTSWLENAWSNPVTTEAANLSLTTLTTLNASFQEIEYLGKTSTSQTFLTQSLDTLDQLLTIIGEVGNTSTDPTLFGHVRKVQLRAQVLDEQDQALRGLVGDLDVLSYSELSGALSAQEDAILAINEFDSPLKIMENKTTDLQRSLRNKLYSLQALLDINRSLLAYGSSDIIGHTWLAEGSIVFRSIITNPSKLISQTVPFKILLPREFATEDTIDLSPTLATEFDPEGNAYALVGQYELAPEESIVVFLESEDIWIVNDQDLDNYRQLAQELVDSLQKTSLYGQAASIKGDITIALEQVAKNQDQGGTPSERIRIFRQSQLTLLEVEEKLATLKQLVNQASTATSLTGFIGGSTALLAWGLLTIILAGFAFLALYIKKSALDKKKPTVVSTHTDHADLPAQASTLESPTKNPFPWLPIGLGISTLIILALVTTLIINTQQPALQAPVEAPLASTEPQATPIATPDTQAQEAEDSNRIVLGQTTTLTTTLEIDDNSSINLRTGPGTSYDVALSLKSTTNLYIFGHTEDDYGVSWTRVGLSPSDSNKNWFLRSDFLD